MLRLYAAYAEGSVTDTPRSAHLRLVPHVELANVAQRRFDTVATSAFSPTPKIQDTRSRLPASSAGQRPRPTPTIIEPEQVRAIMTAALDLPPKARSAHTYHYLFGLLAATGLRISEALALQCDDLVEDGLIVRNGKFGKQRL
jgi:integrase